MNITFTEEDYVRAVMRVTLVTREHAERTLRKIALDRLLRENAKRTNAALARQLRVAGKGNPVEFNRVSREIEDLFRERAELMGRRHPEPGA